RRGHPARSPLEERYAEPPLGLGERVRQGGWRRVQPARGRRQRALLGHGHKQAQVAEVEVGGTGHDHDISAYISANQFALLMHPSPLRSGWEGMPMTTAGGGLQVEPVGPGLFLFRGSSYDSGSLAIVSGGGVLFLDRLEDGEG